MLDHILALVGAQSSGEATHNGQASRPDNSTALAQHAHQLAHELSCRQARLLKLCDEAKKKALILIDILLKDKGHHHPWDEASLLTTRAILTPPSQARYTKFCAEYAIIARQLTDSEVLACILVLAQNKRISIAGNILVSLVEGMSDSLRLYEAIQSFVCHCRTEWHLEEARRSQICRTASVAVNRALLGLLRLPLGGNGISESQYSSRRVHDISLCLKYIRSLCYSALEVEMWSGLDASTAERLVQDGNAEDLVKHLYDRLPPHLSPSERSKDATSLASELLLRHGKLEDSIVLHAKAVGLMCTYPDILLASSADIEILRCETELLSHELSLSLSNHSLSPSAGSRRSIQVPADMNDLRAYSRSQLGQDLWVLEVLHQKRGGYFVEFGAADGVLLSNTWLLETHYGWNGICAEPNPVLYKRLCSNRSCCTSDACVYKSSGECMEFILADAYGGLRVHGLEDQHANKRMAYLVNREVINIVTTSLNDLLRKFNAPRYIDYLSVDTEGSELAILEGVDWDMYKFRCITVEHNDTASKASIFALLHGKGYTRIEASWEDWYYLEE